MMERALARNASDVYSLPAGSTVTDGTIILASQHNTPLNDIAADLNLARPIVAGGTAGTTIAEALTNLKLSTAPRRVTAGGTADAITLTTGASFTALVTGMTFTFVATGPNTGTTTINTDGLGAVTAKTLAGADLPENYIGTSHPTTIVYNGTNWIVSPEPGYLYLADLGPFYAPNCQAGAMSLAFINVDGSNALSAFGVPLGRAGRVVGARLLANSGRVTGTCLLKVSKNGTPTSFADDAVTLDAANEFAAAAFVPWGQGIEFTDTDTVVPHLTFTTFTLASTDLMAWLTVAYEPF